MERYSRFMLRFAHALQRSGAPVEVFVFGTRLTRITRQLRVRSPDAALRRVAERVVDWSGGTRIGESLRAAQPPLGPAHDAERRDRAARVGRLGAGRSRRSSRGRWRRSGARATACIWIDPLAARPGFEPATVGLRAALPYVDEFVPAASVASLEELAARLGRL